VASYSLTFVPILLLYNSRGMCTNIRTLACAYLLLICTTCLDTLMLLFLLCSELILLLSHVSCISTLYIRTYVYICTYICMELCHNCSHSVLRMYHTQFCVALMLCREAVGEGHAHCRSVHFTECPETWKAGRLAAQLEAEKMERSR